MYSASYLEMFYFLLKVNMVCTSDRKAVAFSSLQLYIAKLIAGLTIINMWVSLDHVLMIHKFQRRTRCGMGGISLLGSMHLGNVHPTEI